MSTFTDLQAWPYEVKPCNKSVSSKNRHEVTYNCWHSQASMRYQSRRHLRGKHRICFLYCNIVEFQAQNKRARSDWKGQQNSSIGFADMKCCNESHRMVLPRGLRLAGLALWNRREGVHDAIEYPTQYSAHDKVAPIWNMIMKHHGSIKQPRCQHFDQIAAVGRRPGDNKSLRTYSARLRVLCLCVSLCVCVCERERERDFVLRGTVRRRKRETEIVRSTSRTINDSKFDEEYTHEQFQTLCVPPVGTKTQSTKVALNKKTFFPSF